MAANEATPLFIIRTGVGKISGVYKIYCSGNQKFYIGSSVHIKRRWASHRWMLERGTHHCDRLQRCWVKYGPSSFTFSIIEEINICDGVPLFEAEDRHMKLAGDVLLNTGSTAAAAMLGMTHTADARKKISATHRGKVNSPETRRRMSLAQKGKVKKRGWRHSAEAKAKMSAASLGRIGPMRGKHHPDSVKAKMSAAQKARPISSFLRGGDHGMARPVEIDGVSYKTTRIAARALGVRGGTVVARIRRGMGRYLDDPDSKQIAPWGFEEKTGSKHKNARAVFVGDLRFDCCKHAASHFGIHPATFVEWIQKGRARYADGLPPMRIGPKPRRPRSAADIKPHSRMRPVIIDGITYRAQRVAAQEIGVSKSSIENWLKSGRAAYAPT